MASKDPDSPVDSQTLDVEDDRARQRRIHALLRATDASIHRNPTPRSSPSTSPHHVPPSDLISRAEQFLPRIAAANEALASTDPAALDIEHLSPHDAPHIEMNLALGVFEQRGEPNGNDGAESSSATSSSSSDEESESDESMSDKGNGGAREEEEEEDDARPPPKIVVLSSTTSHVDTSQ